MFCASHVSLARGVHSRAVSPCTRTLQGYRAKRLTGEAYHSLIDEFVHALYRRYPSTLLQFEDFSSDKASTILEKYRDNYLCFNDGERANHA